MKNYTLNSLLLLFCILFFNSSSAQPKLFKWLWNNPKEMYSIEENNYSFPHKEYLNWHETKKYVQNKIASFKAEAAHYVPIAVLTSLEKNILASIHSISEHNSYKKDLINQYIFGSLLDFIEDTSIKYAYNILHNNLYATKIAESMRNNAMSKISQNPNVDLGTLATFIGSSLIRAVNNYQK